MPHRVIDSSPMFSAAHCLRFLAVVALAAGGTDNGGPGLRPQYSEHYYGAFVLDPDGNNVEAVNHRDAGQG